jgi:AAA family ATP:ADP antiporter
LETEAVRAFGAGESAKAARQAFTGELSGAILFWQNIVVMVIQAFFVSRILLRIGVRGALFVLPVLAFGAYLLIAFVPVLSLVRLAKIAENGTDYSLSNTVRGALFLPTSRVAKYKAKAAIDTFFARFGDMLQAGVVFLGVRLAFTPSGFAMVNLAAVCLWLWVAVLIAREHKRRSGLSAAAAAA